MVKCRHEEIPKLKQWSRVGGVAAQASTAVRSSKGASALGGSADLFALLLPKGEATGVQKSEELYSKLLRHLEWYVYFRRDVLVQHGGNKPTIMNLETIIICSLEKW